jgi:hypothetical protein
MKSQLIIICLLLSIVSIEAYASEKEPKKEEKKTQKSNYNFNIFRLYAITKSKELQDSLTNEIKTKTNFRKED